MGHCNLLIAAGRDPQRLILDHLNIDRMSGGHLSEPDTGDIVQDRVHDGLVSGHQSFGRETPARLLYEAK